MVVGRLDLGRFWMLPTQRVPDVGRPTRGHQSTRTDCRAPVGNFVGMLPFLLPTGKNAAQLLFPRSEYEV